MDCYIWDDRCCFVYWNRYVFSLLVYEGLAMQLDMFLDETEMLWEEVKRQKEQLNNVRRGLFARHAETGKLLLALTKELDDVKNFIGYKEQHTQIVELLDYGRKTG